MSARTVCGGERLSTTYGTPAGGDATSRLHGEEGGKLGGRVVRELRNKVGAIRRAFGGQAHAADHEAMVLNGLASAGEHAQGGGYLRDTEDDDVCEMNEHASTSTLPGYGEVSEQVLQEAARDVQSPEGDVACERTELATPIIDADHDCELDRYLTFQLRFCVSVSVCVCVCVRARAKVCLS
jgi:hypothetical protein